MAKQNDFNFEDSIKTLESIVKKLESGDLSLEESIKNFEEGVALSKDCQGALADAEQKVSVLMKENESWLLQPFQDNQDESP